MAQYIEKFAVVAEIKRRYEYWREKEHNSHSIESETRMSECQHLMLLLNILEVKNINEALRTEYEKGRADVLSYIDPDEMVADFCSQPFSKTRSIASVYRQGILDIVKRINNNEETSINSTRSIDDGGVCKRWKS